jgi:hypothetical protein
MHKTSRKMSIRCAVGYGKSDSEAHTSLHMSSIISLVSDDDMRVLLDASSTVSMITPRTLSIHSSIATGSRIERLRDLKGDPDALRLEAADVSRTFQRGNQEGAVSCRDSSV